MMIDAWRGPQGLARVRRQGDTEFSLLIHDRKVRALDVVPIGAFGCEARFLQGANGFRLEAERIAVNAKRPTIEFAADHAENRQLADDALPFLARDGPKAVWRPGSCNEIG